MVREAHWVALNECRWNWYFLLSFGGGDSFLGWWDSSLRTQAKRSSKKNKIIAKHVFLEGGGSGVWSEISDLVTEMPFIIHQYQHRSIYLGDFFILCFHPDKIFWKINQWPHILTCQHMWLHMSLSGLDTMCKIFLKLLYGQLGHFVRNLLRNVITHFGILGRQHKTCNNFEEQKKHVWQQIASLNNFFGRH